MCTMAINNQFNGIELTFESKPTSEVRDSLKNLGFRWHGVKKLWYAKNTEERMALALELSGNPAAAPAVPAQISAPAATSKPVSKYGIRVGDILFDVWGYSMTLVEYYKVTKIVSPSKIEIVEVGHKVVPGSTDSSGGERVLPDPEREIRDRIVKQVVKKRSGDGWYVKINDSCQLTAWDGRDHYQNTWD